MQKRNIIIVLVISVLALILILQNTQSVETRILWITVAMPRALLLFITFLCGFISGIIATGIFTRKKTASKD